MGIGHHRGKKTDVFDYPDLPSSLRPVKHCEEVPVQNCPASISRDSSNSKTDDDIPYDVPSIEVEPHFPNQSELNDLIRDLGLTKSNAEILTSRQKEWNLLDESYHITTQRERHKIFSQDFTLADKVCFSHDINDFFKVIPA